jgi:hypothetical protein
MAKYDWQSWGTTPEKAYYTYVAALASGDYQNQNGEILPKGTNTTIVQNGTSRPYGGASSGEPVLNIPSFIPTAEYVAPTYVAPAEYAAPEYDEDRIAALAQRKSSAGLRAARQALQQTIGGYYENPNVKRMTLRDALAGYGQSVESVLSGADTTAREEYNTEYGIKSDQEKTNYNERVNASKLKYEGQNTAAQLNYQSQLDAEKTNYNATVAALTSQYNARLADYMAKTYGTNATKYGTETSGLDKSSSSSSNRVIGNYVNYNTPTYDRDGKLIST